MTDHKRSFCLCDLLPQCMVADCRCGRCGISAYRWVEWWRLIVAGAYGWWAVLWSHRQHLWCHCGSTIVTTCRNNRAARNRSSWSSTSTRTLPQLTLSTFIDVYWLCTFMLEILWCATSRRQHQIPTTAVRVGADTVAPTTSVRDLGIYIDSDLSMRTQVTHTVAASCFAVLRQLRSIRRSVPDPMFQSLVVSLVLTKLGYGNTTLTVLPAYQYRRLQSVLNAAARLIYRRWRFDDVTSLLRELHWLKSSERVAYKLAVTFYRCLHGLAPSYLAQSVRRVAELDRRRLRSSSSDDVIIPTTRLVTVGDRANSLPPDIRSAQTLPVFCNRLKTYLFSKCFPT